MEKITSKKIASLIEQALKNGDSEGVDADDANMNYARVLVSKYNVVNKTKLSVKRVHPVQMKISAPDVIKSVPGFPGNTLDLIARLFEDPDFKLTSDELLQISNDLNKINLKIIERMGPSSVGAIIGPIYHHDGFNKEEIKQMDKEWGPGAIKSENTPKKNNILG